MDIRPACEGEISNIARLYRHSRDVCLPFLPNFHSPEDDLRFFTRKVFAEQNLYVGTQKGVLVGMMSLVPGWVEQLYLHPRYLGLGYGSQLLSFAKAWSNGELKLWCFEQNVGGCAFYDKHGFVEIERTDGSDNEEKMPDILFKWRA